jgi:hypothetical protein
MSFFYNLNFCTHAKMKKVGKSLLGNILYFLFLYFWRKIKKIFLKFSTSAYSLLMKLFNFTKWKNFIKIHTKEKFNFRFKKMSEIYGKRHISFLNPALQCCKRHKFRVFIKAVFFSWNLNSLLWEQNLFRDDMRVMVMLKVCSAHFINNFISSLQSLMSH